MITVICTASDDYVAKYFPCIDTHKQYCAKHGYEYKLITGSQSSRNWKRTKLFEVQKELTTTDNHVLIIDGDCYIKKTCPPLTQFISKKKSIYYANGKSGRCNSGFMFFKNNSKSLKYVNDVIERFDMQVPRGKGYYVTTEGENGHIIWVMTEYKDNKSKIFQEISNRWNCTSPKNKHRSYIMHFTNDLKKEIYKYNENLRSSQKSRK